MIGSNGSGSSTLEQLSIKPDSVVNVVKSFTGEQKPVESGSAPKKYTPEQLHQITIALRTGFLSPAFAKTIEVSILTARCFNC